MRETPENKPTKDQTAFSRKVGAQETRKLKARHNARQSVWFGLGMTGLIGWSVVVPTLLGVALGIWLDSRYSGGYSWALMLLILGLVIGCANAWHWVTHEDQAMHEKFEDTNDE
ncbi:AtpZ/AtpI family protein [Candidatus Chloroploca sp. Khr17]|uniref:AtpZ/AtpI family protein n=1 Tax=Candidatus Chloroploca sp. Khr17 TaxID=2496869 RepID=UPI00101E1877|nr:AtpZ/AtpI family protein [Candidatus Chloroploca sp. Khr17]